MKFVRVEYHFGKNILISLVIKCYYPCYNHYKHICIIPNYKRNIEPNCEV